MKYISQIDGNTIYFAFIRWFGVFNRAISIVNTTTIHGAYEH